MSETTDAFKIYNDEQTKNLNVAVEIEGVPGAFAISTLFKTLRYGDPVKYGDPDLVYGGLVPVTSYNGGEIRPILSLDSSSLILSQKIEPEQGRSSVSMLTLAFIDYQGIMSQIVARGVVVDDILGKKVKVFMGYKELSFPEDYHVVFRGKISGVDSISGLVKLQISDPNLGRRSQLFFRGASTLTSAVLAADTTIPVVSNTDFFQHILGPDAAYDPAIKLYLTVDDEVIEYGPTASVPGGVITPTDFQNVVRGARGTVAADHDAGAEISCSVEITDHVIDMALKLMLSGWNGDWITDQPLASVVYTGDPVLGNQATAYVLPPNVDAERDLGIVAGDYMTCTGDGVPANNGTFVITSFADLGTQKNRIIYTTNSSAAISGVSTGTLSFRSKYDTYPLACGVKMNPQEVDVERHEYLKNTFLSADNNGYRIYIDSAESSAKTFIEREIYLPAACYSLTRFGRLSVGLTKPPLADQRLKFLSIDNILNPKDLHPIRTLNNRRFFNEIQWKYDVDDAGTFRSQVNNLDTDSLSVIGISSVLPIASRGIKTDLQPEEPIRRRTQFLQSRYKNGAVELNPKVNFAVGVEIEAGDVVALQDDGQLQITNYETGIRNIGTQLFEVIERTLNIKDGTIDLKLLSGIGAQATDRFGTIAPSTLLTTGSTTTTLNIQDSYGAVFPGDEKGKWENYIGQKVLLHNEDWTYQEETTLLGVNPGNAYQLFVEALSAPPLAGTELEIIQFPNDPDPYAAQVYKNVHVFLSANVKIVAGISNTEFVVAPADIGKYRVDGIIQVHDAEWTYMSPEVKVTAIDTNTNHVFCEDLGFVPVANDETDYGNFPDGSSAYRFI
jgi:hypothetical protein